MTFAEQVVEFNQQVLGIQQRPHGLLTQDEIVFAGKTLSEEVMEFLDAAGKEDFIAQIDALIDLQYFCIGFMYKLGLTPEQIRHCMTIVHKANMEKQLGVIERRGDGTVPDAVKPSDWISPEERLGNYLEACNK